MLCRTLTGPLWPGVKPLSCGLHEVVLVTKDTSAEDVWAAVRGYVLPRSQALALRLHLVATTLLDVVREVDSLWMAAVQVSESAAGSAAQGTMTVHLAFVNDPSDAARAELQQVEQRVRVAMELE